MTIAHHLGFPRIGLHREMKKAIESYWQNKLSQPALLAAAKATREANWQIQTEAGLDYVTVGDFSLYDHVLDTSLLFGIIPERFATAEKEIDLNTLFCMARGQSPDGREAHACEMTKWFDTNYHYIVPEFDNNQKFSLNPQFLFEEIDHARALGYSVKPVVLGPLSLLWLGKSKDTAFNKLTLLPELIKVYQQLWEGFRERNITWSQLDEPILVLDLPNEWKNAFLEAYRAFDFLNMNCLLTTYFGALEDNLEIICRLPVSGLHIDCVRAPEQLATVMTQLPENIILSLGVVDGRNIWRANLTKILDMLTPIHEKLGNRLWIAPSCSLLHCPLDLDQEFSLDAEVKSWLAFAKQKLKEIALLRKALCEGRETIAAPLAENEKAMFSRQYSDRIKREDVQQRLTQITPNMRKRQSPYVERAKIQKILNLPLLPTTTIGSFPQTQTIRKIRQDYKKGNISKAVYEAQIKNEIIEVVKIQENLGLDVLVHGEAERNDMVEYFGEQLKGFVFTENGWVQSYGTRCVKPPIIYGDITRPQKMTVVWSQYAQSLTSQLMKGMLTGPVTILAWSFVRDDQPRATTALQLALALRDEVADLEAAGIKIIQIDEPAFRECLPLRKTDWQYYLVWASECFRVASSGVSDATQIHTHMCYAEFNDVVEAIAGLDADVITLESSRSNMELLDAFEKFSYPNEIGPGVYDIHSPRIPTTEEIEKLLIKALRYVTIQRLWINPDCGLKTRNWVEVKEALSRMVAAAKHVRHAFHSNAIEEAIA